MADQQLSAPPRVPSGIRHINHEHRRGYVKIGNHLAQHRELSMTAIGLATHIQSLPSGAKVTIKALAERFPEGEVRIAGCPARAGGARLPGPLPGTASDRARRDLHGLVQQPARHVCGRGPRAARPAPSGSEPESAPDPEPEPGPDPEPALDPAPAPDPSAEPAPAVSETELQARELLARLRLRDPRLVLSERDTVRLAPGAVVWLERGLVPSAVTAALTRSLPTTPIHSPAGLLTHRLRELLPPRLEDPWAKQSAPPDQTIHALRTCDGCDRAFRSPAPGRCRDCGPPTGAAATAA